MSCKIRARWCAHLLHLLRPLIHGLITKSIPIESHPETLGLSVSVRSVRFLATGGIGLFVFATMIVMRHFAEQIGVPLALLVSGIALIGAAILVARLHPPTKEEARR